jgi:hypothetical protein
VEETMTSANVRNGISSMAAYAFTSQVRGATTLVLAGLALATLGASPAFAGDDFPPYAGSYDDASYGAASHGGYTVELPRDDGALSLGSSHDDASYGPAENARRAEPQALAARADSAQPARASSENGVVLTVATSRATSGREPVAGAASATAGEGAPVRASLEEASAAARARRDDPPPYAGSHDDEAYGDGSQTAAF